MAFKEYKYGSKKKDVQMLLRRRLNVLDKIRHHTKRAEYFKKEVLPKVEKELKDLLKRIEGK